MPNRKSSRRFEPMPAVVQSAVAVPMWLTSGLVGGAIVTLVLAYLAALAVTGFDRTSLLDFLFNVDTLRPWLVFHDAFLSDLYPASGWRHGVAPGYFPDYALLWTLFALGVDFRIATLLLPLLFAMVSVGGWIFVCDVLYAKSWRRRAAVIFLHAVPFLLVAGGSFEPFSPSFLPVFHYGTWTVLPWILGFWLRALSSGTSSRQWIHLAGGGVLLALTVASDLIIGVWLVGPAIFSFLLMIWRQCGERAPLWNFFLRFILAIVVSVAAGLILAAVPDNMPNRNTDDFLSPNPELAAVTLSGIISQLVAAIPRVPVIALLWAVFSAVALWRFAVALVPQISRQERLDALIGVAPVPVHRFVALFVPLSAVSGIVGQSLGGLDVFWDVDIGLELRYSLPLFCFPLFIGWALLPMAFSSPPRRYAIGMAVAGACAVLFATGQLAFKADGFTRLDFTQSPFQQCFAENAQRLGWEAGIAVPFFCNQLEANENAGIERMLPVAVVRQDPGQSFMHLDYTVFNRHKFFGEFQFVVVNEYKGQLFTVPPFAFDDARSGAKGVNWIINDKMVRNIFGAPTEIINCKGVGLYHYEKPIQIVIPPGVNPDFTIIGQRF